MMMDRDAMLAVPKDQAEMDFIASLQPAAGAIFWLGITDKGTEGIYLHEKHLVFSGS